MAVKLGLILLLFLLAVALTLGVGVQGLSWQAVRGAMGGYDPNDPLQVVLAEIRLPRLAAGLIAGGALGVAGSVMQALTRNPLADPGLLGVDAGAAFAVVLGALYLGQSDAGILAALAFPGAALAAMAVFLLGGGLSGEPGPIRLTLAGLAMSALLLSLVNGLILLRGDALEVFRFWIAGTLALGLQKPLLALAGVSLVGWWLALWIAPLLETLALGRGLARGLGTSPLKVQGAALLAITLLTGSAVAIAGPIAFLGLIVPPLARRLAGRNLRHELLAAPFIGASVLLFADALGRMILAPAEVRVGVMTAILGGPVFVWIARSLRLGEVR
ncbi:FecCD family ABC transporter permease [Neogemmobacter tilapiae]|uniref:ABC transporter permease n=1 Tax=Neogemmobacter tilapiae TaxID=875041 RepID=A0A918TV72_9RHOB|nr:iron ABC transporter permease [Gemmobacter tilapiae]GHC60288.1 ABC transporter permease [Gemmobacter tilapiae]